MSGRSAFLSALGLGLSLGLLPTAAHADGRFSFGLNIWGPPPVCFGPPCYHGPVYAPPVVVRRVYVTPPPETIYVAPAVPVQEVTPAPSTSKRSRSADMVLLKIGELHSEDNDVREDAAKYLGESRDARAIRPLIECLQHDRKDDVREEAARALARFGGPEAERALTIASTSDPDDDVRRAASKSLGRMARQSIKTVR